MDYIFKPMSYVLVILLGYLLKRLRALWGRTDHRMMVRIMVNITVLMVKRSGADGL